MNNLPQIQMAGIGTKTTGIMGILSSFWTILADNHIQLAIICTLTCTTVTVLTFLLNLKKNLTKRKETKK